VRRARTASAGPLTAGFFSELLPRDHLVKPGDAIEDQLRAVAVRLAGGSYGTSLPLSVAAAGAITCQPCIKAALARSVLVERCP
jgi:hypothetical protein